MMPYGYGYGALDRTPKGLQPPSTGLYLRLFAHEDYFALSSGKITTWQGTGSSGLSAVQATGALQPSPGSGINGKTTVVFGGSQYMTVTSAALGVFDIYVVAVSSTTAKYIMEHGPNALGAPGHYIFTGTSSGTAINRAGNISTKHPTSTAWIANNVPCLVRFAHDGTHAGHLLQRDGSAVAIGASAYTADPGTGTVTASLRIGASGGGGLAFVGEIGEILIYDASPDTARSAAVLAYVRKYWGTP